MKKLVVSVLLLLSLLLSFASCDFVLVEELPLDGNYEVSAEDGYVIVNGVKTEYKVDELEYTAGIVYETSHYGNYAIVTGYTGSASKLEIPAKYNGLPVKMIDQEAFKYNDTIATVIIPDSVTSIEDSAFYGCKKLTSVVIGDGVKSIGNSAFYECRELTSVVIGECVKTIGSQAFRGCVKLTAVEIPDSVTSIDSHAFYNCKSMTSVVIGDGVTDIGSDVFYNCTSLTSIVIPKSVKSIGASAFKGCFNLTKVYYTGTLTEWKKIEIGNNNASLTNCTIRYSYVPQK